MIGAGMVQVWYMVFTMLSIVGNEYIKRRNKQGYWFWLVANVIGIIMFAGQKQWWLVLLYGYYGISCVQGIRHWARLEKTSQATASVN